MLHFYNQIANFQQPLPHKNPLFTDNTSQNRLKCLKSHPDLWILEESQFQSKWTLFKI